MTKTAADVVCLDAPKNPRVAVGDVLKTFRQTLANQYCRLVHGSISRPVAGKYRCWQCHREFESGW
ncbi:MAG TPA: hypothetical protein VKT49_09235 [Bryobacteraceae bacterium]|nr:hypothetical protein [Bryobacteraceae bacterium]